MVRRFIIYSYSVLKEKAIKYNLQETLFNFAYISYVIIADVSIFPTLLAYLNQRNNDYFTDNHFNQEHLKLFVILSNVNSYKIFFIFTHFTLLSSVKANHYYCLTLYAI